MEREADLREFVSARGATLSRAAYLLTGDHQAAEDLVPDTFVVVVRRWQKSGHRGPRGLRPPDPLQPACRWASRSWAERSTRRR
jgi:DNA-directed RNA polymerase specialized sigma24 family protein